MIVEMARVFIAARMEDRDRLLAYLGRMKIMHLEPVKPEEAVADKGVQDELETLSMAIQILSSVEPSGTILSLKPADAAREVIELRKSMAENRQRLNELHQEIRELEIWGDVRLSQLEALRDSGLEVRFFMVPQLEIPDAKVECAEVLSTLPGKRVLLAVADRNDPIEMPASSTALPFPSRDRASVLSEAKNIDEQLKQNQKRLSDLAGMTEVLRQEHARLDRKITFSKAQRSGLSQDELYALQGWLPAQKADQLKSWLAKEKFPTAVHVAPLKPEDLPPTLIRYPAWARPIKGILDMLGILPGYREMDLSPFFMLALPIFAAMLIGDAGYGFLIFLGGLIFYNQIARVSDRSRAQIIIVFGLVTLVWGILTANYFGITPETLAKAGGFVYFIGKDALVDYDSLWQGRGFYSETAKLMIQAGILWKEDPNVARFTIMKVSLIMGCVHLILARFRKMAALIPDQRALAELGWVIVIAGMLGVIWYLLFIGFDQIPSAIWWFPGAGFAMAACFSKPDRNIAKRIFYGLSVSILPLLSTFTDTMSYVRLFAVGLSSYYIASAFNAMALQMAEASTWIVAFPVLIFGHGLNIGLATIAIFAHGVRLNMLEFSNHTGVTWNGYAFQPFNTESNNILKEDIK